MNEHQHCEDDEMKPCKRLRKSLIISCEPPEAIQPAKAALDHPATRQEDKAFFRLRQLDDLQFNAFITRGLRRILTCIALVSECQLHCLTCYLLNLTGKLGNLRSLLLVGRRNVYSQQIAECIDRHVYLAATLALIAIVARTRAAFARGLQRASIQDNRAGLPPALLGDTQHRTQIADHGLKAPRVQPSLCLLIDQFP